MKHFSEIDYTPLCQYLENLIGVPVSIDTTGKRPEIVCISNLTPYVGIMQHCLKSVSVGFFNLKFHENAEPGTTMLWATINLHYQTKQGGNNGMNLCEVWYYKQTGWKFIRHD